MIWFSGFYLFWFTQIIFIRGFLNYPKSYFIYVWLLFPFLFVHNLNVTQIYSLFNIFNFKLHHYLILSSQAQGLANQAKLTEFIDLVKSFSPNPTANDSGINDLEKLADLRDKGIITPTEFEAKKKQILGL